MAARLVAMGVLTLSVACQSSEAPPPAGTAAFVEEKVCGNCHGREAKAWQDSDHDLAMQEATEATVLGDFKGTTFRYAGVTTRFFRRDGKFFVNTDGADGKLADLADAGPFR